MTISYSSKSLWYKTAQNNFSLDILEYRSIPVDDSDIWVKIEKRHEYKPTALSFDLYGTPAYWWIFSVLNVDTIKDPIRDFKANTVIRVPVQSRLLKYVG